MRSVVYKITRRFYSLSQTRTCSSSSLIALKLIQMFFILWFSFLSLSYCTEIWLKLFNMFLSTFRTKIFLAACLRGLPSLQRRCSKGSVEYFYFGCICPGFNLCSSRRAILLPQTMMQCQLAVLKICTKQQQQRYRFYLSICIFRLNVDLLHFFNGNIICGRRNREDLQVSLKSRPNRLRAQLRLRW